MKKLSASKTRANILYRIENNTFFEPNTGCQIWTGRTIKHKFPYGRIKSMGKEWSVHRLTYGFYVQSIPAGLCVLHRCDNPRCVNPDHLFLGTKKDNFHDMVSKQRHTIAINGHTGTRGEKCGMAKLKDADVPKIKKLRAEGALLKDIASEFKVSIPTICGTLSGRYFSHIK